MHSARSAGAATRGRRDPEPGVTAGDRVTASTTIEILYFDGCPNHERLVDRLPAWLEAHGIAANIELRRIPDEESAVAERFLGSPTVRVNGRDIEPGAAAREDYGLKCRIYRSETGVTGMPPDALILGALSGERPDPPGSPAG